MPTYPRRRAMLGCSKMPTAAQALLAVLLLAMFAASGLPGTAQTVARPNVIVIMTDDQGYGDFSCHGNPMLKTPAMDRLAEASIRFTDFHVGPSCTPTRGQLMTGLDAYRNGATSPTGQQHLLRRGLKTMGDVFLENGYRTALYGKWHLGGNSYDFRPHERGFEDAVHYLRGGVQSNPNPWNSDLMDDWLYHNGTLEQFPGYATDVWFDLGTKFVKERKARNESFFLYLPLNAPHGPYLVPDEFRAPYKDLSKVVATFFGMIATVDRRLGTFLEMLEAEGLRENTMIVFLTDNGTAEGQGVYNAGMRGKKGSHYEGGHRAAGFICWPAGGLRAPADVDALTQVQDLLPTLIELCGLTPPEGVAFDGISLAPLLRGEAQPVLDERMLMVMNRTVMWRKWRLVDDELYNLEADPGQERDVAVQHPDIAARMREHRENWRKGIDNRLEPYRLGVEDTPVILTAYDWDGGPRVPNWPHLRKGNKGHGRYLVSVDHAGEYTVSLRRWPRDSGLGIREAAPRYVPFDPYMAGDERIEHFPPGVALDIVRARVQFGEEEQALPVGPEDDEVTFTFRLEQGETEFQTWFATGDGEEFGAYYVYIQRQ